MTISRKGSRRVVVDGVPYRWTVRPSPSYLQALAQNPLSFAVADESSAGTTLIVQLSGPRPEKWLTEPEATVTPVIIQQAVRSALARGWRATQRGAPYILELAARPGPA